MFYKNVTRILVFIRFITIYYYENFIQKMSQGMWFLGQELLKITIRMESCLFVRMKVRYSESIIKKQQFDLLLLNIVKY